MISATTNWKAAFPQNVNQAQQLVHILTIAGYGRVFAFCPGAAPGGTSGWISDISGGQFESDGLACTASNGSLAVDVIDFNQEISGDLATTTFEGVQCTLTSGTAALAAGDFIAYGTYIIDSVECLEASLRYRLNLRDLGILLEQSIWEYGDDGYPTSSSHPRTIQGDPMAILEEILETECGYPSGNLNSTVMSAYQAGLFAGFKMVFSITQPPQAKAWIDQEIFNPLAGFGYWNAAGQYTPKFLLPQGPPSVPSYPAFGVKSILDPIPTPAPGPYCAALLLNLDYDGQNFNTEILSTDQAGIDLYDGVIQITNRQSRGMQSALGGSLYGRLAASATFRRYATRPWILNFRAPWQAVLLELGDVVSVTHPQIPVKGSGMGITNRWYEVQKKSPNWKEGTVDLSLLDVNWMNAAQRVIAPNGTPDYAGSSPTQQGEYLYPDQGQEIY